MDQNIPLIIAVILATTLGIPIIFKLTFAIRKKLGDEKWLAKFKRKTPKSVPIKDSKGLAVASTLLVFAVIIGVPALSVNLSDDAYFFAILNFFASMFSLGLIISLFYSFFPAARNYNVAKQIKFTLRSKASIEELAKKYDCDAYNRFTIKRYIKILVGIFLFLSPFYVLLYFQ
jgi:hypothetical protein